MISAEQAPPDCWELCVDEELAESAWQQAISHGLIRPASGLAGAEQPGRFGSTS
jgi:hypothetical protein